MKNPVEQLETLMRNTVFPGEQDSVNLNESNSESSLRKQMATELYNKLKENRPLRVYFGVDPTKPSLHIGHFIPIFKLKQFQDLGHEIIILMGDFTGRLGDPSGQTKERTKHFYNCLQENSIKYEEQIFKILDSEKTKIYYNSNWFEKMSLSEFIEIASYFPLKQIISRREFQDRMNKGLRLQFDETLYSLFQGYDAYKLNCDVQIGSYDQYFNMLAGRTIQENKGQEPHVIITTPLLMGIDGRKMSKSLNNTIDILDTAENIYYKVMKIPDTLLPQYGKYLINLELRDKKDLCDTLIYNDPYAAKHIIAYNITLMFHGQFKADEAKNSFINMCENRSIPSKIINNEPINIAIKRDKFRGIYLPQLFKDAGILLSNSEFSRLVKQKGIYIHDKDLNKLIAKNNWLNIPNGEYILQKGKHTFVKIKII